MNEIPLAYLTGMPIPIHDRDIESRGPNEPRESLPVHLENFTTSISPFHVGPFIFRGIE